MTIIADRYIRKWFLQGLYGDAALAKVLSKVVDGAEQQVLPVFQPAPPGRRIRGAGNSGELLSLFGLSVYHTGESMENIMKIFHLIEQYPDLSLFVQTNPSYCCPVAGDGSHGGQDRADHRHSHRHDRVRRHGRLKERRRDPVSEIPAAERGDGR